jgi:hypothetical protein
VAVHPRLTTSDMLVGFACSSSIKCWIVTFAHQSVTHGYNTNVKLFLMLFFGYFIAFQETQAVWLTINWISHVKHTRSNFQKKSIHVQASRSPKTRGCCFTNTPCTHTTQASVDHTCTPTRNAAPRFLTEKNHVLHCYWSWQLAATAVCGPLVHVQCWWVLGRLDHM